MVNPSNLKAGYLFPTFFTIMTCIEYIKKTMSLLNSWWSPRQKKKCHWNLPMGTCWGAIWVLIKPIKEFYKCFTGLRYKNKQIITCTPAQFGNVVTPAPLRKSLSTLANY